jgi:thiamine pyrophosphokinase
VNLSLLILPELRKIKVTIENGSEEVFLIYNAAGINGKPGDVVSLIPLNNIVTGVVTNELKYPLKNETLFPEKSRGISNVMLTNRAEVSVESGCLLCIHMRKTGDSYPRIRTEE